METRTVKCETPGCEHRGRKRKVRALLVEDGLVFWPTVLCVCGAEPRIVKTKRA